MSEKLRLQRQQIRNFVGDDPDAIRVIEKLLKKVNDDTDANYPPGIVVRHTESTGTHGGPSVAGSWQKRKLNTVAYNTIPNASHDVATYVLTLPAGSYFCEAWQTFYRGNSRSIRVQDTTANQILFSVGDFSGSGDNIVNQLSGSGYFTLTQESEIEFQYYVQTAQATNGLGEENGLTPYEVYAELHILQINELEQTVTQNYDQGAPPRLIAQHRTPSGTHGGSISAKTWTERELNTVLQNEIPGATFDVVTHRATLPAGKYAIRFFAHGRHCASHRVRAYSVTRGTWLVYGDSAYANPSAGSSGFAFGEGVIELTQQETIALEHWVDDNLGGAVYVLGDDASEGTDNIFAQIVIDQIASADPPTITYSYNANTPPRAHISYQNDTYGGAATTGAWTARPINTTQINEITGCSVDFSGNSVTLPAGKYQMRVLASFTYTNNTQLRVQNLTAGSTIEFGHTHYLNNSGGEELWLETQFEILQESEVQVQYYCNRNNGVSSLGEINASTDPHVHLTWIIDQIATADPPTITYSYNANTPPTMIVEDQKPSGTNGGTFTSGAWQTRDLNTVELNEITGASLSSNQITLPAGTYEITGFSIAHFVDRNKTRVYNVTDGVRVVVGTPSYTPGYDCQPSFFGGRFTISSSKVFEIQHRCQTSRSNDGFGLSVGLDTEIYSRVVIKKVG